MAWLAAAAVLPLWRLVTGKDMVFLSDAFHQHMPFQAVLNRVLSLAPSAVPYWDPYIWSGSPLLANPQFHALYPPAIVYRFLSYPSANGIFLAFHLLLAVAGMYAFLRAQGLTAGGSSLGAVGFGLGAGPSFYMAAPPVLCGYAWLPWTAYFALRFASAGGTRVAEGVGLGLCGAWLFLAGYPQHVLYAAVLVVAVIACFRRRLPGRATIAVAAAVALAASAALLVPFADYLLQTTRASGLGAGGAGAGAMPPWLLLGTMAPFSVLTGPEDTIGRMEYWTSLHFCGVLVFALAAANLVLDRGRRETRTAGALILAGVVLGMGRWFPGVGEVLLRWSPLAFLRHAGLWMCLAEFGLCWAAAMELSKAETGKERAEKLMAGLAVAGVFLLSAGLASSVWRHWMASRWGPGAAGMAVRLAALMHPAAVLLLGALVLWLARRKEIRPSHAAVAMAVITWVELQAVRPAVQPVFRAEWLSGASETEKFLGKRTGWFRVFVTPRHQEDTVDDGEGFIGLLQHHRAALRSNLPAAAGLLDAGGNDPLRPAGTAALLDGAAQARRPWDPAAERAFRLLGVKYLITRTRLEGPGLRTAFSGYVRVLERSGAAVPVRLEPADAGTIVAWESPSPGKWGVWVKARKSATLVVSESFVRGWRARSARSPLKVVPALGALTGVELPAGESLVELRYSPPLAAAFLLVSCLSLAGLFAAGLFAAVVRVPGPRR